MQPSDTHAMPAEPFATDFARPLRAALSVVAYLLNIAVWCPPIMLFGGLKRLSQRRGWRLACDRVMNAAGGGWVAGNSVIQNLFCPTRWTVQWDAGTLRNDGWYLILANHQSWVDILAIQRIFRKRIPFIKFFLKQELIWIPLLGHTWLAMQFPFMKRYSRAVLKNNPHLMGKDMDITRKACENFRELPVSIMHFAEGTRFCADKHAAQRSPYAHLLRIHPKGIAFILNEMENRLDGILDVTIAYPGGAKRFLDFICGDIPEIRVHVRSLPVTADLIGNYGEDRVFRRRFHQRLNQIWTEKDRRLAEMRRP